MSQNSLNIILAILNRMESLNADQRDKLLSIFGKLDPKKNCWIYPGLIKRILMIPINEVYAILSRIEEAGIVRSYLELHCPNCNRSLGEVYETLAEVPEDFSCANCENDFEPNNSLVVIYRVVSE